MIITCAEERSRDFSRHVDVADVVGKHALWWIQKGLREIRVGPAEGLVQVD